MTNPSLNLADIRKDYILAALDEDTAGDDPIGFFRKWFAEAEASQITEVNAMTLATADGSGRPHARIVLLKGLDDRGFVFFTNYDSNKGLQINANPMAAIVFFWKELERQVRIEGSVEKIAAAESDEYFFSRPRASRIGTWASPQSKEVPGRETLDLNYSRYEQEFASAEVPRPAHWGGYRLVPHSIEYWQGRASRMHDRILFEKNDVGDWDRSRLAP